MSRLGRFIVQVLFVLVLYYILSYFNLVTWYVIIGILILVLGYAYFQVRITDNELYFEMVCNTTMYLRRLNNSKDAKNDTDSYHLGLAYAAMYQGDVETLRQELNRVDNTRLPNPKRQLPIYIRMRAYLAHADNNKDLLDELMDQAEPLENESLKGYITVQKLRLNDQYEELIILLKDLIPKETVRLYIIELEYYLALVYKETDNTEDALAILEFIVKRGFGIGYTDWAYETYIEIKDNQEENSISQEN